MKLRNEFTVAVPLERAWETLLDIERVAGFLPGATIEPGDGEGVYHGSMRVKLGPMVVNYQGTARMGTVDEQGHTAEIAVEAREAKGQGTASATIRNTLEPADGGTRVIAETDLKVTGRQAQFGRGIMQDVAGKMLGEFARRFEEHLTGGGASAPGPVDTPPAGAPGGSPTARQPVAAPTASGTDDDALDLGNVLAQTATVRYAGAAAAIGALSLLAVAARRRRRRGVALDVSYSW